MARLAWCHLCDYAFLDGSGKPCLIGLFDRVMTPALPATHRQAALAFRVTGAPQEVVGVRVLLLARDGAPLVDVSNPHIDLGPAGVHDAIIGLHDLTLQEYGRYEVRILLNGDAVPAAWFDVDEPPLVQ